MAVRKKGKLKPKKSQFGIVDSAHQVWLAGLGAMAKAQDEGPKMFNALVKEGAKMYESLVAEGGKLQNRSTKSAKKTMENVREVVEARLEEVRGKAAGSWDQLEDLFQDRVARALNALGVPTADEVKDLSKQVKALNKNVKALSEGAQSKARRKTTRAKKTAATKRKPTKAR